ncbi:tRNA (adenosine(37)-N6)-dimethylallyltransferase MiaA [Hoylesella loescheii]|uniref:tRNA dimethylallyltransferase n=1 Tax=Hoylesella loescheii DSM 19665 = JCM 12249 = ATCC 15930 TaxID=1122985 RepID=A0A069QNY1_HOYLO|nr:tRNA (adenosine(37)-N6)-dimethylallyltransferase MiaA [Hoylesella loescheii]KDR53699.1 tRNA dimethylallyltransferase [Hoylesella loescheii DSM 19665 = JCM 12249 = ATCC 15930]
MITILGPTACGKTALAVSLAAKMGGEIISADSRQVYRGMDIGTGKDLSEYQMDGKQIPYHLIDIEEAGQKYNLFRFQEDFNAAYEDITSRGVQPILCGGTGLYMEAVLKGYALSPVPQDDNLRKKLSTRSLGELKELLIWLKARNGSAMHNETDVDTVSRAVRAIEIEFHNLRHSVDTRRVPAVGSLIVGLDVDRDVRRERITARLKARLEEGMVEEVRGLLEKDGITKEDLMYYGLEYKYVTAYVVGEMSYEDMFNQLEIAIHQFAKRQMTWFRGMERRGFNIHWLDASIPMADKLAQIERWMAQENETAYEKRG